MVDPDLIVEFLLKKNIRLASGVPDSVLTGLSASLEASLGSDKHVIAANEGNALSLALGHYLATGNPAIVYMQNSGLGNIVNPVTSLAHADVYGVPMFLVVGWRGAPGAPDEPQHVKQGRSTTEMLDLLDIPWWEIDLEADPISVLQAAWAEMSENVRPVAILIRNNVLAKSAKKLAGEAGDRKASLQREAAIAHILELARPTDALIATTGKAGRELYELRQGRQEANQDFLTVGGMGHASSIALGIALEQKSRRVVCLDGDGAMLMHMGSMAVVGALKPENFVHILLNNQSHESVGGQPTVMHVVDTKSIVLGCGYENYVLAEDEQQISEAWAEFDNKQGPFFLEITIAKGARSDLGRPTMTPAENKAAFMKKLGSA